MRLLWSPDAVADRTGIFDWFLAENPAAALATDTAIARHTGRLRRFPHLGRPGRIDGTRELPLPRTPFIIVYRLTEEDIILLRILHGARLWPPPDPAP
jgi:toxin ParE1/3/4